MAAAHRSTLAITVALSLAATACASSPTPEAPSRSPAAASPPAAAAPEVPASVAATPVPPPSAASPEAAAAPAPPPPIPPNTAVLHIGDSMVQSGLAQGLRPRFKELKVRYEVRGEESTFTTTWAGRMDELVAATQPDLVIITLGGNEIGSERPEAHAKFVRRIVNATKGRPCVWMTAPLWRHETGIYDVIQKNAAPCRFFETDRHLIGPIERRGDKIHPTPKGGAEWAGLFWGWLESERVGGDKPWAMRPGSADEYAPRGLRAAPSFPGVTPAAPPPPAPPGPAAALTPVVQRGTD